MNSYRERLKANQGQPCVMRDCERKRIHFSKYCATHAQRGYQYGHPQGRRIRPKEYEEELAEVMKTFEQNPDHEGIQIAIKYFEDWLQNAAEMKPGVLAAENFYQLYQEGVTGVDLLAECSAIYLYQKRNPWLLPDGLPLYIALALGVLCKRKNRMGYGAKKYVSVQTRRNVGRRIAENVGLLLMNIASAIQQCEREREYRRRAFQQDVVIIG